MRRLVSALFSFGLVVALGTLARSDTAKGPRKFSVGVGQPASGRVVRGATAPGGTLTVTRASITVQADGSQVITLIYQNGANAIVSQRTLLIDSACSRIVDNMGNVVLASGPTTECSAASAFITQVDSSINAAATGGKLNL
jgi:hypothetical protein